MSAREVCALLEAMGRRDFMKRIGGAIASTMAPSVPGVAKAASGVAKAGNLGSAIVTLFRACNQLMVDATEMEMEYEKSLPGIVSALKEVLRLLPEDETYIRGNTEGFINNLTNLDPHGYGDYGSIEEWVIENVDDVLGYLIQRYHYLKLIPQRALDIMKNEGEMDYEARRLKHEEWSKDMEARGKNQDLEQERKDAEDLVARSDGEVFKELYITITLPRELAKTLYRVLKAALE